MGCCIRGAQETDCGNLTDHESETHRLPATIVLEVEEYLSGGNVRTEHPEDDHDCQETSDMQNHDCILHAWQPMVQPDVEDDTNKHDGENEQRALPSRSGIVGVLDDDQGLDQRTADEASGSVSSLRSVRVDAVVLERIPSLPTQSRDPTRDIRQELLTAWRREL